LFSEQPTRVRDRARQKTVKTEDSRIQTNVARCERKRSVAIDQSDRKMQTHTDIVAEELKRMEDSKHRCTHHPRSSAPSVKSSSDKQASQNLGTTR
jgi:hypothetical protein